MTSYDHLCLGIAFIRLLCDGVSLIGVPSSTASAMVTCCVRIPGVVLSDVTEIRDVLNLWGLTGCVELLAAWFNGVDAMIS